MGKKRRRQTTAGSPPPPPPPPPPLVKVAYDTMPTNHKRKFFINDDVGGSLRKYIEMINWLRVMGCFDGSVFEDIPNLNWSGEGYPLVEIEVVTPQNKFASFIITKSSLYLIGCCVRLLRFQFKCEFVIDSFTMLEGYDGRYTSEPWKSIGPKRMIDAINLLDNAKCDDLNDMSVYVAACEVFYVHLSEAARLYVVESLVCRTLEPTIAGTFGKRTYEEDERFTLRGDDGKIVENEHDVYSLIKGDGPVDFNISVDTPDYIGKLIGSYKLMSKVWLAYALTGRRHFEMEPRYVSMLHMRSRKSLKCTLAVLCNTNLNKILKEWKKKSKNHTTVTPEVYEEMVKQVQELQEQKKVLLQNARDDS